MENGAFANNIYPDETPHNAMSHQGLHYSPCLAHSWCNVTVNNISLTKYNLFIRKSIKDIRITIELIQY